MVEFLLVNVLTPSSANSVKCEVHTVISVRRDQNLNDTDSETFFGTKIFLDLFQDFFGYQIFSRLFSVPNYFETGMSHSGTYHCFNDAKTYSDLCAQLKRIEI